MNKKPRQYFCVMNLIFTVFVVFMTWSQIIKVLIYYSALTFTYWNTAIRCDICIHHNCSFFILRKSEKFKKTSTRYRWKVIFQKMSVLFLELIRQWGLYYPVGIVFDIPKWLACSENQKPRENNTKETKWLEIQISVHSSILWHSKGTHSF